MCAVSFIFFFLNSAFPNVSRTYAGSTSSPTRTSEPHSSDALLTVRSGRPGRRTILKLQDYIRPQAASVRSYSRPDMLAKRVKPFLRHSPDRAIHKVKRMSPRMTCTCRQQRDSVTLWSWPVKVSRTRSQNHASRYPQMVCPAMQLRPATSPE